MDIQDEVERYVEESDIRIFAITDTRDFEYALPVCENKTELMAQKVTEK